MVLLLPDILNRDKAIFKEKGRFKYILKQTYNAPISNALSFTFRFDLSRSQNKTILICRIYSRHIFLTITGSSTCKKNILKMTKREEKINEIVFFFALIPVLTFLRCFASDQIKSCKCKRDNDISIVMEMARFNKMNRIESNRAPLNDL